MGTRGVYGFYKDGKAKVTYNHFDSYPDSLGLDIKKFVHSCTDKELERIFDQIEMIDEEKPPTNEQIKHCIDMKTVDTGVSNRSFEVWYCLLRKAQGDLSFYKRGLKYMTDSEKFLDDGLFCEWGYIINLDKKVLTVLRGGKNKVCDIPFDELRKMENDAFVEKAEAKDIW